MSAIGYHDALGTRNITRGFCGKFNEVSKPADFSRLRVVAERHDVIFGSNDQKRRWRDLSVFIANGLLVDHLKCERRGASPPWVVGTERHANKDVGQWLVHLWVGMDEIIREVTANGLRIGPVQFVRLKRFIGLRGDALPVIG